jgi:hypothetical protein
MHTTISQSWKLCERRLSHSSSHQSAAASGREHAFKLNPKRQLLVLLAACAFAVCLSQQAAAQSEPAKKEFWPEINVYVGLKPKWRLMFLANVTGSRETKARTEAQAGVHVDYLWNSTLQFRAGYRYVFSLDGGTHKEHRILIEQTVRLPLPAKILLSDRNREELRIINGDGSFRYRNRVTLEREFDVKFMKVTPYVSGELFYDTRFDVFNRNRMTVGVQFPILKRLEPFRDHVPHLPRKSASLDIYYTHQNDSRSSPNHVNAAGATLVLSF